MALNLNITTLLNGKFPIDPTRSLSLIGTSKAELQSWVTNLPILNIGNTAKQLYLALQELAPVEMPEAHRLEHIEILRPALYSIIESLSKHFLNPHTRDQRAWQIAELAQELRAYSAMIYYGIALRTVKRYQSTKFNLFSILKKKALLNLIGQAIHRGLTELFQLLSNARALHVPDYSGLWLRLHELYRLAISLNLGSFMMSDRQQSYGKKMTIEQIYLRSILLSAYHTHKLREAEIRKIRQLSELWSDLVRISPTSSGQDLLWVDTTIDTPPMYTRQLASMNPAIFHIDVHPLLNHFMDLNSQEPTLLHKDEETELSTSLKLHLLQTLSAPKERASERQLHEGTLTVTLGFIGSHYQLAGLCSFEELMQIPETISDSELSDKSTNFDHCYEAAYDEETKQNSLNNYCALHQSHMINISATGYCIRWIGTAPHMLRTGELISIRKNDDSGWSVGLVRWVQQHLNENPQFGVEILSDHGIACGARVILQDGNSTDYMRTLLLPHQEQQNKSTILTPTQIFKAGHKISIRFGHDEFVAELTRARVVTQSFSQFEFVLLPAERAEELISKMLIH